MPSHAKPSHAMPSHAQRRHKACIRWFVEADPQQIQTFLKPFPFTVEVKAAYSAMSRSSSLLIVLTRALMKNLPKC